MPANVRTMMYYGEKPWHGLGVELDHPATAVEAISAAGMDWEVEQRELFIRVPAAGEYGQVDEHFANVRKDTGAVLGVVGAKYEPIQNKEAFEFFDSVVGGKMAIYHTAGVLGAGERVWILAKLPGTLSPVKGDEVDKFLLLANSHNGWSALRMLFTPIRVVCQNTLSIALRGAAGQGIAIRHSGDVMAKAREAQRVLGLANKFYADFSEVAQELARFKLTDSSLESYYNEVLQVKEKVSTRTRNVREELVRLFEQGKGHDRPGVRGTLWAAFNAVAEYTDHVRVPRAKSEAEKTSNRLESVWFGSGARMKDRAFQEAVALVKK